MGFMEDLLKRVQGGARAPEAAQKPQPETVRQPQPTTSQSQGNEVPGADPAVKEIRTYKRDGNNIIEEYECLNPDGTVTKTISIGDKKEGLKKYEVYKMDKSGIVRRVDNSRQEDAIPTGVVRDMWFEELERMRNMSAHNRGKLGGEYEYTDAPLSYRYTDDNRQGNRPYKEEETPNMYTQVKQYADSLGPERRAAIFNDYKEKLLQYGTSRLQNILLTKLDNKKLDLDLTDEQKAQLVDYGNKKLRTLLDKSVDEERFFTEVWPRYESMKKYENTDQQPQSKPVSFSLNPSSASKPTEEFQTKPVSFVIRPEFDTKSYAAKTVQNNRDYVQDTYSTTVKDPTHEQRISDNTSNELKYYETVKEKPSLDGTLAKLKKQLKQIVNEDKECDKLDKEIQENYIDQVIHKLKRKFKELAAFKEEEEKKPPKIEKIKSKELKPKKFDVTDYFDSEEIFDYGLKALRKLWKDADDQAKRYKEAKEANKIESKYRTIPMRQYSLNRSDIAKEQQKRLRLEDPVDIDSEEENRYRLKDSLQQKKSDSRWDSNEMFIPLQKKQSIPSVETSSKQEKEDQTFDSLMDAIRSKLLAKKESAPPREKSREDDYFQEKRELEETYPWKTPEKKKEAQEITFDLSKIIGNMKNFVKTDSNPSQKQPRDDDYDDEVNSTKPNYDSTKTKESADLDIEALMNKTREKLYPHLYKQPEPKPKQVKFSSPYSYYKPPHSITSVGSRKPEGNQNGQNATISFQIRPKDYSQSTEKTSEPFVKQQISYDKPNPDEDFAPWWFNNIPRTTSTTNSYIKETVIPNKPVASISGGFGFGGAIGGNYSQPQLN